MTTIQTIERLPDKYHSLLTIRSPVTQRLLVERIVSFFHLLSFLSIYQLTQEQDQKIKRFIAYLDHSCSTPTLLDKRVIWLSHYAMHMVQYLCQLGEGNRHLPDNVIAQECPELTHHAITFLEAVAVYVQCHKVNDSIDLPLLDRLISLTILATDIIDPIDTGVICRKISDYTDLLLQCVAIGTPLDDPFAPRIIRFVKHINWTIESYLDRDRITTRKVPLSW